MPKRLGESFFIVVYTVIDIAQSRVSEMVKHLSVCPTAAAGLLLSAVQQARDID